MKPNSLTKKEAAWYGNALLTKYVNMKKESGSALATEEELDMEVAKEVATAKVLKTLTHNINECAKINPVFLRLA